MRNNKQNKHTDPKIPLGAHQISRSHGSYNSVIARQIYILHLNDLNNDLLLHEDHAHFSAMRFSALALLSLAAGIFAEPAVTPSGTDALTSYNTQTMTRTVFMVTTQTRTGTPPSSMNSTLSYVSSSIAAIATGGASGSGSVSSGAGASGTAGAGTASPSPFTGAAVQNAFPTAIAAIAAGAALLAL